MDWAERELRVPSGLWDCRPNGLRRHFGIFGGRFMPTIFVPDPMEHRPAWPGKEAGWSEVMALFTDLHRDGTAQIAHRFRAGDMDKEKRRQKMHPSRV